MAEMSARRHAVITIVLCYLAAILEGFDLQSMGLAGRQLREELALSEGQFGLAASLGPGGLMIGALIGGRIADRIGRKMVLAGSVALYGVFSLGTAFAGEFEVLLLMRLLVGIGLGGAFPNLVALSAEAAGPKRRSTMVSLMYAGVPMGTIFGTSAMLYFGDAFQWRWIFYFGGLAPLVLAPLLLFFMPESASFKQAASAAKPGEVGRTPLRTVLFGEGRATTTIWLWLGIFFTLLVITFLTNWMPQLIESRGFLRSQAITVLLAFGVGSIVGNLVLGFMSDTKARRFTGVLAYAGVSLALFGLSRLTQIEWLIVCGFSIGFFGVGAYLLNLTLAPRFYPARIRATGVGWDVAASRAGSLTGPLLGGLLLDRGASASTVLVAFVPGLAVAALAVSVLLLKPATDEGT